MKALAPALAALGTSLGLITALAAGPAGATTNPHQGIYQAALDVGYRVSNDHDECATSPDLTGFVTHRGLVPQEFVICTGNARSLTDAFTTLRHEGIHVAQICNGGLLFPQDEGRNIARAQDEGWHILGYPENQWSAEAEARVMANEWDAYEVTAAIRHFCF